MHKPKLLQKMFCCESSNPTSEDEDIPFQPKRSSKSKTHTIILSEDEDERPPSPEVTKKKTSKTGKKLTRAQLPKVLKTDDTTS
jgi:hypothetical protein